MVADLESQKEKNHDARRHLFDLRNSRCRLGRDDEDLRDLIRTTPLVYDADGLPVGYEASQLFGLEAAYIGGRA